MRENYSQAAQYIIELSASNKVERWSTILSQFELEHKLKKECKRGNLESVKAFIKFGYDLNLPDDQKSGSKSSSSESVLILAIKI